jgi:hypothetical protein
MLCPTPSVNAAVVLLVNAYSVIVSGGRETSQDVVIVMVESPEPTPFLGSAKLTVEGAAETVRVCPYTHLELAITRNSSANTQLRDNICRTRTIDNPRKVWLRGPLLCQAALLLQLCKLTGMASMDLRLLRIDECRERYTVDYIGISPKGLSCGPCARVPLCALTSMNSRLSGVIFCRARASDGTSRPISSRKENGRTHSRNGFRRTGIWSRGSDETLLICSSMGRRSTGSFGACRSASE